jgi:glycosyltransferase involved in cell wall biosynthesis
MEGSAWGGSEELWSACALDLVRRGCHVTACVKKWPTVPPAITLLSQAGAVIRYRNPRSVLLRLAKRLRYYPASFLRRKRASLTVISEGCSFEGVEWMEACQAVAMPYVAIVQAALPWIWPGDRKAERFRAAYLGAKKVYFVSHANLELVQRQLNCDLTNSKVIRNPFKVPYDSGFSWPSEDGARWGCVARLDTYIKGQDILLDVLDQDKWRNRSLRVTLYGTGGNHESIRSAVEKRNLVNVSFAGQVSNTEEIWRREQCLILPSRAEGLPLVIVEAMLSGRPCIVTNVAGNTELIEDNVNGFIAESPSVTAVDEAMERAWQNRHLWKTMGECAATSIRRLVPAEPAHVFADELAIEGWPD